MDPTRPSPRLTTAAPHAWAPALLAALFAAPFIAAAAVLAYYRVDLLDDQLFAFFGWRLLEGDRLYIDIWDNKPPGIFWINALALAAGGGSYLAVVLFAAAAVVAAHVAFYLAASAAYSRGAAALATMLLAVYLTHGHYSGGSNRTETYVAALELAAIAIYTRAFARPTAAAWLAAGACCGLAFCFKQVGLAAFGAIVLHQVLIAVEGAVAWRLVAPRLLLLATGLAAAAGAAAGALALRGELAGAIDAAFLYNRVYFANHSTRLPFSFANAELLRRHVLDILTLPLLLAAAALLHAVLWRLRPAGRPAPLDEALRPARGACPSPLLLFIPWLLAAAYGALLGPHGFLHYVTPLIAPLALVGAYLLHVLMAEASLLGALQRRASVCLAFVAAVYFAWHAGALQFEKVSTVFVHRIERGERTVEERTAQAVASLTEPGDRIHCFGFMPAVYRLSGRAHASRYATSEKITHAGRQPEARAIAETIEADLRRVRPAVIVMTQGDYLWLSGRARTSLGWPAGPSLAEWIRSEYVMVDEVTGGASVPLFLRRDRFDPTRQRDLSERLPARAP